ncbi:MAG: AAA family ATPase [Lachnospiraceae bacterium]|nr:AAA family ATPase [Lachnospiraceae bacterium]MCR5268408.1 AAA family ATPase [Lachnospiraceae bacterium]
MRLISLHIDHFGNLSDFDLKFDQNPTVILHENGWGKSTLAAFIKVMFYGFSGELKKTNAEREREKYRPWMGGTYGGNLTYEADGKRYQVTKVFGARQKEDSCTLIDTATGFAVNDVDAMHLGEELFALDERSFLRSVFIAQNDVRVHEDGHADIADGISAKIGNLSDATDDVNRYEAVMERLNDLLNKMSPKRATGSIKQMDAHISSLQNNLRREGTLLDNAGRLQLQIKSEEEKLQELYAKRVQIERKLRQSVQKGELLARKEAFQHLWDQYEDARKHLEQTEESYVNGLPVDEEVGRKLELWKVREDLKNAIENRELQLNYLIKEAEDAKAHAKEQIEYVRRQKEIRETQMENTSRAAMVLLGVAIVLLVAGAVTVFVLSRLMIGAGIVGGGVLSLVVGLIVMLVARIRKKKISEEEVDEELLQLADHDASADISQVEARIKADRDQLAIIETNVEEFLRHYQFPYKPETVASTLYDIRQRIAMLASQVADVESKREDIRRFENANDMTSIMNVDAGAEEGERDDLEGERNKVETQIGETQEFIRMYTRQLDDDQDEIQSLGDMRMELERLRAERDQKLHNYRMLTMTRDYLKKAKENFSAKYRKPLLDGFKKYYGRLSAQEVSEFQLDANIHMTKRAFGEARDVEAYSSGDRDLVDICLRMALIDAMYQDEKPFVVLDDPFVNLDQERTKRAMTFLSDVAKDYQVIYFTCHEARAK